MLWVLKRTVSKHLLKIMGIKYLQFHAKIFFAYLNLWDSCQFIEVLKALGGVDYTKYAP